MDLHEVLGELRRRFQDALGEVGEERALEELRVAFLGRSGEITLLRRNIGQLSAAERPAAGKTINDVVAQLEKDLEAAKERLEARSFEAELTESLDVTFPAIEPLIGTIHPVRRIIEEITGFFERRGFAVLTGPEVEPDYYTFDALNIPADHPARDGFDSFFINDKLLLRPHTSPMQIRAMQRHKPPIAVVAPGKCYRRDAVDVRHLYQFHQIEGLLVAEGVHFGHLKGILTEMCRELFGADQQVRFRPSYFPFTEPSAEVDTTCPKCHGSGKVEAAQCNMCGGSGWIELGGSGMVHPNVLREVGYDPDIVSGWAFGFGIERVGLPLYEVDDVRRFVESDPDFLLQLR